MPDEPEQNLDPASQSAENILPGTPGAWDRLYREDPEGYYFGREPSMLARTALMHWKLTYKDRRGSLLDLGCGEGRDAVFFAQKGFAVTAVDGSPMALEKTARLAEGAGVEVTRLLCPARDYVLPDTFSFLHVNNCLQFLGADCLRYLAYLQRQTLPGGFHSIAAFTREAVPEQEGLYRFRHNQLKRLYRDWHILTYQESLLWREPLQCYLSFAEIIARR